jgi:hypothetical protein
MKSPALLRIRSKRVLFSMSAALAIALLGLIVTLVKTVHTRATNVQSAASSSVWLWLLIGLLAGLLFFAIQASFEYRKRTYDPTWALKYQEDFYQEGFVKRRAAAATNILKHLRSANEPISSDVDDVLDFFEDLGFYCKGDQISPEVIHHHFYHWLRPYLQATESYVREKRTSDPAQWEHLEYLFGMVNSIEAAKSKTTPEQLCLKEEKLREILEEEAAEEN